MEVDNHTSHSEKLHIYRKMSKDEILVNVPALREDLVNKAISFLSSPKVANAPYSQKEAFLRTKGLTPEEIKLAFDRGASSFELSLPPKGVFTQPSYQLQNHESSIFYKFREILQTVALLTGVAYGVYYFIKNAIVPFLFGKPKKPAGLEGAVLELNSAVKESIAQLRADVQTVKSDLEKVVVVQTEQQVAVRHLGDIKSEVATVKCILLSRHQFPTVNLTGSASIPAWQMAACPDSGDRSSEAEIVPHSNGGSQGSDSSLEMIKEAEVAETES